MKKIQKYNSLLLIILLIISAVLGYLFLHKTKANIQGIILPQPRILKPFVLTGINNKIFNNQSLYGHWTILFFGFTKCTSVCPLTMHELANMYDILQQHGIIELPKIVMISIDPINDTKLNLTNYVHAFNQNFYGAIGTRNKILSLANDVGVAYIKNPNNAIDIQHTNVILLCNPQGKLAVIFTAPHNAKQLAMAYEQLII